jgi:hypothetical protein
MNEVDLRELVDVGQRTALLLGEITGRLIMLTNVCEITGTDQIPYEDVHDVLMMMNQRIANIYYGAKDES